MERLLARRAELIAERRDADRLEARLRHRGRDGETGDDRAAGRLPHRRDPARRRRRVAVGGWTAPKLEPEIAIHLGPGGEGVAGISAAIELADADRPPTETEAVLAGDIYHRAVVLDRAAAPTPLPHPIAARIERDGEEYRATDDAEAEVGRIEDLAAWTVDYLSHFGDRDRGGRGRDQRLRRPAARHRPGQELRNDDRGRRLALGPDHLTFSANT